MKFELGTTITELSTPAQYPLNTDSALAQAKEKSASGVTHVESFNVKTHTTTFVFVDMPSHDFAQLLSFFLDVADGMMNEFLLTDDLGGVTTVRFTTATLPFTNTYLDLWSGSITVEEVD